MEILPLTANHAKNTQNACLKQHLMQHKSITQFNATITLGILRLSERIREIEMDGWRISHDTRCDLNRYGKPVRFTEYVLLAMPEGFHP